MRSADAIPDDKPKPPSPYRSEAEHSIADMLTTYGIPFYYKQPTLIVDNGRKCIEYADFFLPTYAGLSIDYRKGASDTQKRQDSKSSTVHRQLLCLRSLPVSKGSSFDCP